jgi:hypothetical protein
MLYAQQVQHFPGRLRRSTHTTHVESQRWPVLSCLLSPRPYVGHQQADRACPTTGRVRRDCRGAAESAVRAGDRSSQRRRTDGRTDDMHRLPPRRIVSIGVEHHRVGGAHHARRPWGDYWYWSLRFPGVAWSLIRSVVWAACAGPLLGRGPCTAALPWPVNMATDHPGRTRPGRTANPVLWLGRSLCRTAHTLFGVFGVYAGPGPLARTPSSSVGRSAAALNLTNDGKMRLAAAFQRRWDQDLTKDGDDVAGRRRGWPLYHWRRQGQELRV